MSVITVTLSPAIDVHCTLPKLTPTKEHLATVSSRDMGGKGINISRVLTAIGTPNTAFVVLGNESEAEFASQLSKEGLVSRSFVINGRIRENITLHTEDGNETRISFSDPLATDEALWQQIESEILMSATQNSIVTITGRIPEGISVNSIKKTLLRLRSLSVKTVVDSKSFSLGALLESKPWLIKPNEEEIEEYTKQKVTSIEEAAAIAKSLHARGIENVIISLGAQGAVLACDSGCYCAIPPAVKVKSTVGAGDSTLAGFLSGFEQGFTAERRLALAVACGTASCTIEGTAAPTNEKIIDVLAKIRTSAI